MKRKILVFVIGVIGLLFIAGCTGRETDTQLSRRILNGLCSGNQRVQGLIDWEKLKAVGVDVGESYSKIIAEKERQDYRKAFFYNCAFSFRAAQGKISTFSNWRVSNRTDNTTIVATDTPAGKVLLLTLANISGKRKLIAIEWQQ